MSLESAFKVKKTTSKGTNFFHFADNDGKKLVSLSQQRQTKAPCRLLRIFFPGKLQKELN